MSFLKNQPIEIENGHRFRSCVLVHLVEKIYGTLTAKLFREFVYTYGGFSFVAMPETRLLGAAPRGPLWALNGPPFGPSMGPP